MDQGLNNPNLNLRESAKSDKNHGMVKWPGLEYINLKFKVYELN